LSNRSGKVSQPAKKKGMKLSKAEMIAIPIIIIIVIWIGYSVTQPSIPGGQQSTTSSSTSQGGGGAPDFTLPIVGSNGLTGQSLTLSSLHGKYVLLEFMEPWCPHCQNIAPKLETLYNQYGANVVFVSVSGPWNGATAADTAKFIGTYGTSWTYLYDSSGTIMSSYGVTATPTFFIVGKDGSLLTSCTQGESCYGTLASDLAALPP